MAYNNNHSMLLVIRHSPYGSSLGKAALDVGLAAAAFDYPVSLLFMGDGVLQLLPEQDGRAIGTKDQGRLLASLPLYDITQIYVDAHAMTHYGVDAGHLPLTSNALKEPEIHALMASSSHLVGF